MKILILQGPNLNLLGVKSSQAGDRLTLDKLNKAIRKHVHGRDVELKSLQTHKQFQAINFLQRNRKDADGVLLIPTSWARNDWTLTETLALIGLPISVIYFDKPYSFGTPVSESILAGDHIHSFTGQPVQACKEGIDHIITTG